MGDDRDDEPPYFDEDDLIQDYMDDMEEEPPPDDMDMDMPPVPDEYDDDLDDGDRPQRGDEGEGEPKGTASASAADGVGGGNPPDVDVDVEVDLDAAVRAGEEAGRMERSDSSVAGARAGDDGGRGGGVAHAHKTSAVVGSGVEEALYGFERFGGASEWRTAARSGEGDGGARDSIDDNDDSRASWIRRSVREGGDASKGKTVRQAAPDAQLVAYLSRRSGDATRPTAAQAKGRVRSERFAVADCSAKIVGGEESRSVTLANGDRVHVRVLPDRRLNRPRLLTDINANGGAGSGSKSKNMGLLERPMSELMRRADRIERRAAHRRKRLRGRAPADAASAESASAAAAATEGAPPPGGGDGELPAPSKAPSRPAPARQQQRQLWVDKYAPTSFSHLLSDERTNREFLRGLRAWDPYVFKRPAPPRPTVPVPHFGGEGEKTDGAGANGVPHGGKGANSFGEKANSFADGKKQESAATNGNADDVRPDVSSRVLLLSGPPGVGKTTLAHVAARHAGYRPIEINASDERSAGVLTERVRMAMDSATLTSGTGDGKGGSNPLLAGGGRPNCVILDEIDGADARSAISSLVQIIREELPSRERRSKKGASANSKPYLRRPLIFICNHKYAPVLRALLPYAKSFDVSPPKSSRLVARLRTVLGGEGLAVRRAECLNELASGSGGDIRSCLHTLQFASSRAREEEEEEGGEMAANAPDEGGRARREIKDISQALSAALGGGGRGMKDRRGDVAGTLSAVFRKLKRGIILDQNYAGGKGTNGKGQRDMERVLKVIDCFGDTSKTLDGLFTNVPRISYVDPTLDRCAAAQEWLSGADVLRSFKSSVAVNNPAAHAGMQHMHIPCAAAAVHFLCRVETRPDLVLSQRAMMDCRFRLEENRSLLGRFVDGLPPNARSVANVNNVVADLVPYALWVLSAGEGRGSLNRAVSSIEMLNGNVRDAFDAHVAILRGLGLTYTKIDEGFQNDDAAIQCKMRLDPEIDKIISFSDFSSEGTQRKEVPSVLKELLAHGARLERMKERDKETKNVQPSRNTPNAIDSLKGAKRGAREVPEKTPITKKHKIPSPASVAADVSGPTKSKANRSVKNFLGVGAARAKAARTKRRAELVGFDRTKKLKLSNSGSGVPLNKVLRFKYQKGFSQAVRVPCKIEDLL